MTRSYKSSYQNDTPYIPQTLSEIWDLLGSMWLSAPTFVDYAGDFPERGINTEFQILIESFGMVRAKLGDQRYAKLIDLAVQAKARFAADPDDKTGESDVGRKLLSEIEDIIREVRTDRVMAKLKDEDGEITGD